MRGLWAVWSSDDGRVIHNRGRDGQSETRVQGFFDVARLFDVNIVFHAAAYKHVSIVEENPIEGIYNKGDNVILIEDVTTTGGSVIDAAKILEEHGLKVSIIYSILSRSPVEIYYNDLM